MTISKQKITIAIDGFSSCGKSTLAKSLAEKLNYIFIDTGAMYRAVTLFTLQHNWISENHFDAATLVENLDQIRLHFERNLQTGKPEIFLNDENVESEIRGMGISNFVSQVAAIREVRTKLVAEQREMGQKGGVVMDGRDIGSVVFPDAELKLFLKASPEIRAQRRYKELLATNPDIQLEEIQKNLQERDFIDSTRAESPLIQTADAVLIDNSDLTPADQLELAMSLANERIAALLQNN